MIVFAFYLVLISLVLCGIAWLDEHGVGDRLPRWLDPGHDDRWSDQ